MARSDVGGLVSAPAPDRADIRAALLAAIADGGEHVVFFQRDGSACAVRGHVRAVDSRYCAVATSAADSYLVSLPQVVRIEPARREPPP